MIRRALILAVTALATSLVVIGLTASPAAAADYVVTTDADSGEGSLRDRLADAAADDEPSIITFADGITTIVLHTGLVYDDDNDITIDGGGDVTVMAKEIGFPDEPVLLIDDDAGDTDFIEIRDVSFEGGAEAVRIRAGSDEVSVTIDGVTATGGFTGLAVRQDEDFDLDVVVRNSSFADTGGEGLSITHAGTGALDVEITGTTVTANGLGDLQTGATVGHSGEGSIDLYLGEVTATDNSRHGLQVLHEGIGSIYADITHSSFSGNGFGEEEEPGDGLNILHDGSVGSQYVTVSHSEFFENKEDGVDVQTGVNATQDVTIAYSTTRDNGDDGFEINNLSEDSGGSPPVIDAVFGHVTVENNGDDTVDDEDVIFHNGISITTNVDRLIDIDVEISSSLIRGTDGPDFGEDSDGHNGVAVKTRESGQDADIDLSIVNTNILSNHDDGVDVETGDDATVSFTGSTANNNGDDGVDVSAADSTVSVTGSSVSRNGDEGLDVNGQSDLDVTVIASRLVGNGDDNLDVSGLDNGTPLRTIVLGSTLSGAGEAGIEASDGSGLILAVFNDLSGNGAGPVDSTVFLTLSLANTT